MNGPTSLEHLRLRIILTIAVVLSGSFSPGAVLAQTFNDVPTDHWAYSFIESLAWNGITAGCGNGDYCPEDAVTRDQMAVFLERGMNGSDYVPPPASGNVFLDVGVGDFAANFIEQLHADGITAGCGDSIYCPTAEVSRAQMAVFLLRAKYGAGYSPPSATGIFADIDLGYWASAWIEALAAEGITAGCGGGNYCPERPVTRDQMAVLLVRAFNLAESDGFDVSIFRSSDDPRIFAGPITANEEFVLYGSKAISGAIVFADTMYFLAEDSSTFWLSYVPEEDNFVGWNDGVRITLTTTPSGELTFLLEAGTASLTITGSSVPTNNLVSSPKTGRSEMSAIRAASYIGVKSSQALSVDAPITDVLVTGCVAEAEAAVVAMTDEGGEALDTLFGRRIAPDRFQINIPYLNGGDQAFAEAAQHGIEFLGEFGVSEETFSSIRDKLWDVAKDDLIDQAIEELKNAGNEVEVYEEWADYVGWTSEQIDLFEKRAQFKVFLGKSLDVAFKSYDVIDKLFKAYQGGLVIGDFIDAYAAKRFDQIQLRPSVLTNSNERFYGTGSGLISPNGPYPELTVEIPEENCPATTCGLTGDEVLVQQYYPNRQTLCNESGYFPDGESEWRFVVPGSEPVSCGEGVGFAVNDRSITITKNNDFIFGSAAFNGFVFSDLDGGILVDVVHRNPDVAPVTNITIEDGRTLSIDVSDQLWDTGTVGQFDLVFQNCEAAN